MNKDAKALPGDGGKDFDQWRMSPRGQAVWKRDTDMTLQVTGSKLLVTQVKMLKSRKVK